MCRYQRFESNACASVNQLEQLSAKVADRARGLANLRPRHQENLISMKTAGLSLLLIGTVECGLFRRFIHVSLSSFSRNSTFWISSAAFALPTPNVLPKINMKKSTLPTPPHTRPQGHGEHPRPPKTKEFAIPPRFLARCHPHSRDH